MAETAGIIIRYLQDLLAAERSFEDQLAALSRTGDQEYVQQFCAELAEGARRLNDCLTSRLTQLGGTPSSAQGTPADLPAFSLDRSTRNLILVYSATAAGIAMCEALATVAHEAGDGETERLAREMRAAKRSDLERTGTVLERSAREAFSGGAAIARKGSAA